MSWSVPSKDTGGGELTGAVAGYRVYRSEDSPSSYELVSDVSGTSYEDVGLSLLTTYYYQVSAYDGAGNESGRSGSISIRTGGVSVPGGVVASGEIGQIVVRWSALSEDDLLGYEVLRSSSRGDTTFGMQYTTELEDVDVEVGVVYRYRVVAVVAGDGGAELRSDPSVFAAASALLDDVAPGIPGNVSVVLVEGVGGQVRVSWSTPTTDAGGGELTGDAIGYRVYRSEETPSSFVFAADVSGTSYEDVGLSLLTTYHYQVSAYDGAGNESGRSGSVSIRTTGDDAPPATPSLFGATADRQDTSRVRLSWIPPEEDLGGGNLTGLSGYLIYRFLEPTGTFVTLDVPNPSASSYTDTTDLRAFTTYYYRILAYDDLGNESPISSAVSVTTTGISVPTGLRVAGIFDDRVEISWNANPETDLQEYRVYRSESLGGTFVRLDPSAGESQYVDRTVVRGKTYYYKVTAVNANGIESRRSQFVAANVP